MDYLEKTKERIKKNSSFLEWNKNNALNPYEDTQNEDVIIGFHGTFTASYPIEKINLEASNKDYVHGVGGLYLSNNNEDVNQFYLDSEREGSDFQANIYDSMEKADSMFKRINIDAMEDHEYVDFDETIDFLEYVFKKKDSDEFFNIFGFEKDEFNLNKILGRDGDELYLFAKRVQMKTHGLMLPCVIKMENPAYIIKPFIAKRKGFKTTSMFCVSDNSGESIDDRIEKTKDVLEMVSEHFNLDKEDFFNNVYDDEASIDGYQLFANIGNYLRILNSKIEEDMDVEIEDYIHNLVSEDGYCEDEMYFYADEITTNQIRRECENYEKLIDLISDENLVDEFSYKAIKNQINEELEKKYMCEFDVYSLLVGLGNKGEIDAKIILKNDILPKIYDGFVYHANSEFSYVSNNFEEDIFHYVLCESKNVKYLYNQEFSNKDSLMHKRVYNKKYGLHLSVDKINKIIEQFQNKYDVNSKITVSDYNDKSAATFDRENNEIIIYKNHIKSQDDLRRVLFHEVIVHESMTKFMEKEDRSFFLNIYRDYRNDKKFKEIELLYPEYDSSKLDGKLKLTEEFLAHTAEDQLLFKSKGLNKFIYGLKKIMNKICEQLNIDMRGSRLFLNIDKMEQNKRKNNKKRGL